MTGAFYQYRLILAHYLFQLENDTATSWAQWLATSFIQRLNRNYLKGKLRLNERTSGNQGYVYKYYQKDASLRLLNLKDSGMDFIDKEVLEGLNRNMMYIFAVPQAIANHEKELLIELNSNDEGMEYSCSVEIQSTHWISVEQSNELNAIIYKYLKDPQETARGYKLEFREK